MEEKLEEGVDNPVTIKKEEEEEFSNITAGDHGDGDETKSYDVEEKAWFQQLKTKEKEKVKNSRTRAKKWIDQLGLANAHGTEMEGL